MDEHTAVPRVRRGIGLPSRVVVVLRAGTMVLPGGHDHAPLELGFADLVLLDELGRAGSWEQAVTQAEAVLAAAGVDHAPFSETETTLRGRGLEPGGFGPGRTTPPRAAAAASPEGLIKLSDPQAWVLTNAGFVHCDHEGERELRVSAAELAFAATFAEPITFDKALGRHQEAAGGLSLPEPMASSLTAALLDHHLLVPTTAGSSRLDKEQRNFAAAMAKMRSARAIATARTEAHLTAEADRVGAGAPARVPVVPVNRFGGATPLSLGLLLSFAEVYDGGRLNETYDLFPRWEARSALNEATEQPAVFCFSDYLWTHEDNLAASKQIKRLSPTSVTVHGGPDAPKYPMDVRRYFAVNSHIDVVVHGEGEVTFAEMLDALGGRVGAEPCDLSLLADVAGLSFRRSDGSVQTNDARERLSDLDVLPSPFLNGMFDTFGESGSDWAILETNRGCPYGCTYCDWGSATASRIRKFDLERVFAEIEWCASHGAERIFMADANFGILERDVQVATKIAEMKVRHGYPKRFFTSYAKNTVKHLRPIVEIIAGAGILSEGLLSLQSMDEQTLDTINRSNIKTEKYDDLAAEFEQAGLPLIVDLMLGLPGSTTDSLRQDLQKCIDRDVPAKVYPTELLVNSPMNNPAYRDEHQIQTAGPLAQLDPDTTRSERTSLVVSSRSFTRDDYHTMLRTRHLFLLCENFGVLRHVSRHVRQMTGLSEMDFYEKLSLDARQDPDRWPTIDFTLDSVPTFMAPPVSWRYFTDEVRAYLADVLGVPDDSALRCIVQVQHAMLPARERAFPITVDLEHDYAAWYDAVRVAKRTGHRLDWQDHVPSLASYPPGRLEISDELQVCTLNQGFSIDTDDYSQWELTASISRAMAAHHLASA